MIRNLQSKSIYKGIKDEDKIKEPKLIFDTFIISLYQNNTRICEIHFTKTCLVIGGFCYISQKKLSRKEAKRRLQSGYAEKLGLIKEAWKLSEI